jgi:outer membrane receptor for ferrienterochelin and colicins
MTFTNKQTAVTILLLASLPFAHAQVVPSPPAPSPSPSAPSPSPSPTSPSPEGSKPVDAPKPTDAAKVTEPLTPAKLENVEVRANRDQSSSDGITRVVGQDELSKYGDGNVLDVLKRQPGITVSGGQLSLRGIGSAYVRILVDGQRPPPGFSLDTLAPNMVERIEIMPSSGVEFSSQSIGGTINIILKRTRTGKQGNLSVAAESNTDNSNLRATSTWGDSSGPWAWFVSSNARVSKNESEFNSESLIALNGVTTDQRLYKGLFSGTNQSINFGPRLTYTPSPQTRIQIQTGGWMWSGRNTGNDSTLQVVGTPSILNNAVRGFKGSGHGHWFNGEWNQTLSDSMKLEFKTRAGRWYNRNRNETNYGFINANGQGELFRELEENGRGSWQFAGATVRKNINTEQNASFGLELSRDTSRNSKLEFLGGVNRVLPGDELAADALRQNAAFVRHEFQISNEWASDIGVRWESVQFDVDLGTANQRLSSQHLLAPSLQFQFKPGGSKTEQYRIEIGRKWKPLRAFELSQRRNFTVENRFNSPDTIGNPNLRPEQSFNLDLAYTRRIGTEGSLGATLLFKRIDDVLLRRTSFNADGRWESRNENIGSGTVKGIELEYKGSLSELFSSALPKTQIRANIGRYWSAVNALPSPGNRLASQTPLNFNTGFDHRVDGMPLTWGGSFKYNQRGLQRNSEFDISEQNSERSLGLYLSWVVNPNLTFKLAAENMFAGDSLNKTNYSRGGLFQTQQSTSEIKPMLRINFELKL